VEAALFALVARRRVVEERRFGPDTAKYLEEVLAFPEQYERAVAEQPDAGMFEERSGRARPRAFTRRTSRTFDSATAGNGRRTPVPPENGLLSQLPIPVRMARQSRLLIDAPSGNLTQPLITRGNLPRVVAFSLRSKGAGHAGHNLPQLHAQGGLLRDTPIKAGRT